MFVAWGKLTRDADGAAVRVHPLVDHMLDVSACLLELARCPAIRRSLERTAGRKLTDADLSRLAVLTFLHDVGKANAGFQGRFWSANDPEARWWPRACGHGPEGWELVSPQGTVADADRILAGLPLEAMAE